MRTKFKRAAWVSGLLAIVAVTVVSCSDETTSPSQTLVSAQPTQVQTQYAWVGQFHSEGLAYAYQKLAGNRGASKTQQCEIAFKAIKDFAKTFKKPSGEVGVAFNADEDPCADNAQLAKYLQETQPVPASRGSLNARLAQMNDVFDQNHSYLSASDAINSLNREASSSLPADQAAFVVAAGSIGLSSIDYWKTNLPAWTALAEPSSQSGLIISHTVTSGPGQRHYDLDGPWCDRICSADLKTFISSLMSGWWTGYVDVEQAAFRAAVASALTAIFA